MRFLLLYSFHLFMLYTASAQTSMPLVPVMNGDAVSGKPSRLLFSQRGIFYVATSDGLYVFNGSGLEPVSKKQDSLRNITALFEERNGTLWIGCADGSIFLFSNNLMRQWKPQ